MNFVNSFLLWTTVGSFLPILIHILNRKKPKRIVIPTVKFIIRAVEKSSGSRKLNTCLLILVRMLILICLSLIIARPQINKFMGSANTAPVQAVLVIDNAFYTAHVLKNNHSQLQLIKEKAKKIIRGLPRGSQVCILSSDKTNREFTEINRSVFDKVDKLSPAPVIVDMRSMISTSQKLLNKSQLKTDKRIYVLSDMNLGSWQNNYQLNDLSVETIHLVPITARRGNIFINDVKIKGEGVDLEQSIYVKRTVQVLTEIRGDRSLLGVTLSLKINDKVVDEKTISEDKYFTDVSFTTRFEKSGTFFCEVYIESEDGIEEDNHYFFTIYVQAPAKVLILNDTDSKTPLYYKAALAPSGWHGQQKFDVQIMDYSNIKIQLDQHHPQLIILGGSMNITGTSWNRLKSYIELGGSLMICPDENTEFKELNRGALSLLQGEITPLEGELTVLSSGQSAFAKKLELESLAQIQVHKTSSFEDDPSGALVEVPLRFSNKKPCLLIRPLGNGDVIFWGLSPEPTSSNFLSSESFPLIWHLLAEHFSNNSQLAMYFSCNQPVNIKAKKDAIANFKVQSPSGTVDSIPMDTFFLKDGFFSTTYTQTFLAGHYKCSSATCGGFSCNIDRNKELYQYPSESEYADLAQQDDSENERGAMQTILGPDGLLLALILAMLALMLFETHLGNRSYHADH